MPKLTIQQWPVALETAKSTVLDTALSAGVPYPHGCRIGECGYCKSELISGEVKMASYDEAILSLEERKRGVILACRAHPETDVHVAWLGRSPSSTMPVGRLRAQVTNIEVVTPNIRRLYIWPERQFKFAAGQYARLEFGDIPARSYSMANCPDDPVLEFHVRLIPDGEVSGYLQTKLQPGTTVRLQGPFGQAHLRADHRGPLIAVAGGSGLAPMKSIVKTALKTGLKDPVWLLSAVKSKRHLYDHAEFMDLCNQYPNLRYQVVFSRDQDGELSLHPIIEATRMAVLTAGPATLYSAGPAEMVNAVADTARSAGLDDRDIYSDAFFSSGQPETLSTADRLIARLQESTLGRWRPLTRLFGA